MINHSCQPNVTWNFEGRELRVITTCGLSAGDEIYFSYMDDLGDYHRRRRLLTERWGIICACPLCKEGPKGLSAEGPGKPFGDRILKLKENGWPDRFVNFFFPIFLQRLAPEISRGELISNVLCFQTAKSFNTDGRVVAPRNL